jgi:hypothetical protein
LYEKHWNLDFLGLYGSTLTAEEPVTAPVFEKTLDLLNACEA